MDQWDEKAQEVYDHFPFEGFGPERVAYIAAALRSAYEKGVDLAKAHAMREEEAATARSRAREAVAIIEAARRGEPT